MARTSSLRQSLPVIGITGGFGSGKSSVATMFGRWGGIVVSGDEVGRIVVEHSNTLQEKLLRAFGPGIRRGGRLDRAQLARRAFASRESLATLNRIVHPPLIRELNRRIRRARMQKDGSAVVVDAALLVEWGREQVPWDMLVGVWAPRRLRCERLLKRGWTEATIRDRMRLQISWTARRALVDRVVKNDGTLAQLERRARLCWRKVLS